MAPSTIADENASFAGHAWVMDAGIVVGRGVRWGRERGWVESSC
jgi:hypothetical protein